MKTLLAILIAALLAVMANAGVIINNGVLSGISVNAPDGNIIASLNQATNAANGVYSNNASGYLTTAGLTNISPNGIQADQYGNKSLGAISVTAIYNYGTGSIGTPGTPMGTFYGTYIYGKPVGSGSGLTNLPGPLFATDFGADKLGVLDSTASLQAAINYSKQYQRSLFLPAGHYNITSTLCLTNIEFYGQGQQITYLDCYMTNVDAAVFCNATNGIQDWNVHGIGIINKGTNVNVGFKYGANITAIGSKFEDIFVKGFNTNIWMAYLESANVINCNSLDAVTIGFYISAGSGNDQTIGSKFSLCRSDNSGSYSWYLHALNNYRFENCEALHNGLYGFYTTPNSCSALTFVNPDIEFTNSATLTVGMLIAGSGTLIENGQWSDISTPILLTNATYTTIIGGNPYQCGTAVNDATSVNTILFGGGLPRMDWTNTSTTFQDFRANVTTPSVSTLTTNTLIFTTVSAQTNTLGFDATASLSAGASVILQDRNGNTVDTIGTIATLHTLIPMRANMKLSGTAITGVIY